LHIYLRSITIHNFRSQWEW